MDNHIEKDLSNLLKHKDEKILTNQYILTQIGITINRIISELEEAKTFVIKSGSINEFSTLLLGTQLEKIKQDIIDIKLNYKKRTKQDL